ncbi:hypothetical protein DICPUDRAFT_91520 [Dictyostelium purpureum]|uniref:Uncharacterized protein n=1 Tax=Dictyostelium purpureum TaxID=5786 RepID=F0ZDN4_DICPU|nr:uncharacterized protein DICPUDRAFT_91520 [Dictyostelium purpureum]EGC37967.1 hypothetical protein DICPUDRAFT_91520 [Dictyostelium purpureum]|eukprot:XP_003285538.1 hypothetical protein DICPUDRAFT_91520 [Dictyostelium purpureum]
MAPKVFGRVSKYNLFEYLFGTKERGSLKVSDLVRYRSRLDHIIDEAKGELDYYRCPYCQDIIQTQKSLSQPHQNRFSNKSCLKYHLLRIHKENVKEIKFEKNENNYERSRNPNYRKCKHTGCSVWITSKHMCDHIVIDHHIEYPEESNQCQKCQELKKKLKKEFINACNNFYQTNKKKTINSDIELQSLENEVKVEKSKKIKKNNPKKHKDKKSVDKKQKSK